MASNQIPFNATSPSISISVTSTASAGAALPAGTDLNVGNSVRIVNEGPNVAFLDFATTAATAIATLPTGAAASSCTPVLAGEDIILTRAPSNDLFISAICRSAGTAVLTVTCGEGV